VISLQDFERELEPEWPPGGSMVDEYITFLFDGCAGSAGRILVVESDGRVAGFVCVLTRVPPEGPDEPPEAYAYVSDLVVLPEYRGRGMGAALLERAETAARESGAKRLDPEPDRP
jgi:GNAT superfamily N-acetyltransferase